MEALFDLTLYLVILGGYFAIGGAVVWAIMKIPFVSRRINAWLDTLPMMDDD